MILFGKIFNQLNNSTLTLCWCHFYMFLSCRKNNILKFKLLTFLVLLLSFNHVEAQRIYPIDFLKCESLGVDTTDPDICSNFDIVENLNDNKIIDGDLSTYETGEFKGEELAFLAVVFAEKIGAGNRVGVKLGFENAAFSDFNFISTISFYGLDDDFFRIEDTNGNEILIEEVSFPTDLELGMSSFEIILEGDFTDVYGIELLIDNASGIWNDIKFRVYDFYIIDESCNEYVDFIFSNEIDNNGSLDQSGIKLNEIDPGKGFVNLSFLFDSYSFNGDSIYMEFEQDPNFTVEDIDDFFQAFSYSDNVRNPSPVSLDEDKANLKKISERKFVLTFPIEDPFNRIQFILHEKLVLKDLYRKSGGNPLSVIPYGSINNGENGVFLYREGIDPIILEPEFPDASVTGFQWFFDFNLQNPIENNSTIDGVNYFLDSDGVLRIENLPYSDEPFIIYLSVDDPGSGCTIVKKIDFEVEKIILPLFQITLNGEMISNQNNLLTWEIEGGPDLQSSILRLEKAGDDLMFDSIWEGEWVDEKKYTFNDYTPFLGNNFYRIAIQPKEYKELLYSDVINIRNSRIIDGKDFVIFPNPFDKQLNIQFNGNVTDPVNFRIYGTDGKQIMVPIDSHVERPSNRFVLDLETLNPGVYIINIHMGNFMKSFKILKK